jgi:hypothetical protein
MRVLYDGIVYCNPHPNYRAADASASSLTWSRLQSVSPALLCAFRVGQAKTSPDGELRLMLSHDLGRNWQSVRSPLGYLRTHDGPNLAGFQLGSDVSGLTVLAGARMWIAAPESSEWSGAAGGVVDADSVVTRVLPASDWDLPSCFDFRPAENEWAIPCGPPLSLGSNHWLLPMESHSRPLKSDWLRRYRAFTVRSSDGGVTWGNPLPSLNSDDGVLAYYDQRMERLASGRILTIAWVHDVKRDITISARAGWSEDDGRSWTAPHDLGILGGPINPLRLKDGRIFAVYNRRTAPTGVRCCLSEDDGLTWQTGEEIIIWDEARRAVTGERAAAAERRQTDAPLWGAMWGWTFGTPVSVQAPDETVLITFFAAGQDGVRAIRVVQLELGA